MVTLKTATKAAPLRESTAANKQMAGLAMRRHAHHDVGMKLRLLGTISPIESESSLMQSV